MDYQRDEPVVMAAPATNEVTTLIALEFHLKLMIPSGGLNLAPHHVGRQRSAYVARIVESVHPFRVHSELVVVRAAIK